MSDVANKPVDLWHRRPRLCSVPQQTQPRAAVLRRTRKRRRSPGGFTLVEVLATIMLLLIVIPAIQQGISVATGMASSAKKRTEASGLAESKLNELLATGTWQNGSTAGDFGSDWPDYHWQSTLSSWQYDTTSVGLQELDVSVTYKFRNTDQSVMLSSLTYVRADNSTSGTSTGASSGTPTQ